MRCVCWPDIGGIGVSCHSSTGWLRRQLMITGQSHVGSPGTTTAAVIATKSATRSLLIMAVCNPLSRPKKNSSRFASLMMVDPVVDCVTVLLQLSLMMLP